MHAEQVTPRAERSDVVVLVAAARRSEPQVMRRDIAPAAHRARTATAIAKVDLSPRDVHAQQVAPGFPEREAEKLHPAHAAGQPAPGPRLERMPPITQLE